MFLAQFELRFDVNVFGIGSVGSRQMLWRDVNECDPTEFRMCVCCKGCAVESTHNTICGLRVAWQHMCACGGCVCSALLWCVVQMVFLHPHQLKARFEQCSIRLDVLLLLPSLGIVVVCASVRRLLSVNVGWELFYYLLGVVFVLVKQGVLWQLCL